MKDIIENSKSDVVETTLKACAEFRETNIRNDIGDLCIHLTTVVLIAILVIMFDTSRLSSLSEFILLVKVETFKAVLIGTIISMASAGLIIYYIIKIILMTTYVSIVTTLTEY